MRLAIDIADLVADEINSGSFGEEFLAARDVLPEFDLSELFNLKVTVVPKSVEITPATRDLNYFDVAIDIGIQQKIGKDTDAEVARLSDVVSEIVLFLNKRDIEIAKFKSIANEPVYIPEHLSEKRLFTSIITVTYRTLS